MAIRIQDQFEKSAKESLRAVVVARQSGQSIGFSKSYLQSPFGKLDFSGQIKGFQNPSLDLNLNIAKLDLMALSRHVPLLKPWHLAGYASGGINIKGTYESNKGIESSPLSVQGQVQAQIPKLVFAPPSSPSTKISSSNATPSLDPNSASAPPTSYLPQWQVIKSLRLKTKLNVGSLQYHDLKLEDLAWDGGILTGQLLGRARIGKIFSGQIIFDEIKTQLLTPLPTLHLKLKASQIDLGEALSWSMPEWKKLADGKASGDMTLLLPAKERKDFVQAAFAKGEVKIQNGYLSTLPFDKMINAKLASLPQIGLAKTPVVKTEGVRAQLDAAFEFQNGKLNLSRFHALTPDKNELTASGWILASDKSMDLKGQGFIANPPIQGDVLAANSDSQGRLVLPIHFKGTADNPSYNLADDTAKQLLTKTASYTAQKVKKQVQEGAVKEVKKQIQNQLKNILGQ
jgi:hypothetical protein